MRVGIDIETNMAHDHIWDCCMVNENGKYRVFTDPNELRLELSLLEDITFVHWNGIGFDIPKLKELWGVDLTHYNHIDGMLLSRLFDPNRAHSLASYGEELNYPKHDFHDYDEPAEGETEAEWTKRRQEYCIQDVKLTLKATELVERRLAQEKFGGECVELEHGVAVLLEEMQRNGFMLDTAKAMGLCNQWNDRLKQIEIEMQQMFPPIVTERYSEKTGKRLKDGVEEFNPGSRAQIARRLQAEGVKLTKYTEKGNPIVDETTLAGIDHPCAVLVQEYLLLQKREGQVRSWLDCVKEDGRVHGKVMGNGAITGRMTHSLPNMAQIPSTKAEWGKECRECWTVPEGYKLVGIDASGLELRMLAHYMKDDDFIEAVCYGKQEDGTDAHTRNQKAAGLTTRDDAKTFIYAFMYGAGNAKLGSIAGGSAKKGASLRAKFLQATPSLGQLIDLIQNIAETSKSVPGLDGRRIRVRKTHAALNTLLQGNGAIVLKRALLIFKEQLVAHKVPHKFVANVHDEWQLEVPQTYAQLVGQIGAECIKLAGEHFNLRCPLAGEYHVGDTWAETH